MKRNNVLGKSFLMSIAISLCFEKVAGQSEGILSIGDAAPPLKYSKWIKGEPVTSFDNNQVYVLEFWATWCGPCKAAMPHLTKLQKDYLGRATFISVNVWEKVPKDKPYESSLPLVEKFVKGNDANMGYSVIADNNDQFMGNKWLKAAGQNGIPSTFIVKNNKVLWIGHPNSLDSTLPKILDGTYNMQAFKIRQDKSSAAARKQAESIAALFKPIEDAIKAKEYEKAFELMENLKAAQPMYTISMDAMKFKVLLNDVNENKAIQFAEKWKKENKSAPSLILGEVYENDDLSKQTYLWAAANFEEENAALNPVILHALAACYAKGGDYKNAVLKEEKAVEGAKQALKEGKMIGSIMDYTVKEYEAALTEYKKKMK